MEKFIEVSSNSRNVTCSNGTSRLKFLKANFRTSCVRHKSLGSTDIWLLYNIVATHRLTPCCAYEAQNTHYANIEVIKIKRTFIFRIWWNSSNKMADRAAPALVVWAVLAASSFNLTKALPFFFLQREVLTVFIPKNRNQNNTRQQQGQMQSICLIATKTKLLFHFTTILGLHCTSSNWNLFLACVSSISTTKDKNLHSCDQLEITNQILNCRTNDRRGDQNSLGTARIKSGRV